MRFTNNHLETIRIKGFYMRRNICSKCPEIFSGTKDFLCNREEIILGLYLIHGRGCIKGLTKKNLFFNLFKPDLITKKSTPVCLKTYKN
jgi:hypothetical protein